MKLNELNNFSRSVCREYAGDIITEISYSNGSFRVYSFGNILAEIDLELLENGDIKYPYKIDWIKDWIKTFNLNIKLRKDK